MFRAQKIKEVIAEHLSVDPLAIENETSLEAIGMDSIDRVDLTISLEHQFDQEFLDLPYDTVNDILAQLEVAFGPEQPSCGVLNLSDDEFINRYKPERDKHGNYYRQRDWTCPEDQAEIEKATAENRIWTAGDDDNGNFCISSGWHYVNRLYYIITERPVENTDWNIQVPSEEEITDHMQKLAYETDTEISDWEPMEGPETGVGIEYWYRHRDGLEAYVVDDQGEITIEISKPEEA